MQKEVLSLLVSTRDTFTQNEVYFSRINGRQVCLDQELNLTASQKFLDNRKFSGNLIELALAIKNHGIASLLIRTLEDLRVPVSGLLEYREQIERVCILQEEEVAFQGLKNERFRLFSQFVLVGRLLGEPESEPVMGIVAEYYPRLPR